MAVLFELFSFQKLIFLQIFTQMISGDNKLKKQELSELDLKIISNVMELNLSQSNRWILIINKHCAIFTNPYQGYTLY